jgi:hypothetical protein
MRAAAWPPPWFRWLPPLFLVLGVVLEAALPPKYFFGSLLSAAILLAALVYPPLGTAATGAACIVVLIVLNAATDRQYDEQILSGLITLCVMIGLVTLMSVVRVRAARQLSQVRAVAQAAQLALLRPLPERIGPVRMAGCYQAATDEALIGGDLYSVRRTPYGLRVLVGDVRGKGIGATGAVATILASFREAATVCTDLPAVAERIEAALALDREDAASGMMTGIAPVTIPSRGPSALETDPDALRSAQELFATAVLMEIPEGEESVRVLARGHPPLLRLGPEEVTPLEPLDDDYALPLGLGDLVTGPQRVRRFALPPDRMLVAYSDGVTEARDRNGEFYPLRQRLAAHFTREATDWDATRASAPADIVDFIQRDVNRWARTLNDDLVVVVLQRSSSPDHRPTATS